MSISTQGGGSRRPSAKKAVAGAKPKVSEDTAAEVEDAVADDEETDAEPKPAKATKAATKAAPAKKAGAAAKSAPAKAGAKKVGARPTAKGGGRRTIAPVRVSQGRNWGPIILFGVVILAAVAIVGFGGWQVYQKGLSVEQRVNKIDGVVDYRKKDKNLVKGQQHAWGPLTYAQNPPVGGKHNPNWQNCMGDIYDEPIAKEHAVHSMEHGAVWIAYDKSKLSAAQIAKLTALVKKNPDHILMSPYEGLDKAVAVQAWGFQLKADNPADPRIAEFIKVTRKNAAVEAGGTCDGGITATGTTPHDIGKDAQQDPSNPTMPATPGN
jgi:hypothetical protein